MYRVPRLRKVCLSLSFLRVVAYLFQHLFLKRLFFLELLLLLSVDHMCMGVFLESVLLHWSNDDPCADCCDSKSCNQVLLGLSIVFLLPLPFLVHFRIRLQIYTKIPAVILNGVIWNINSAEEIWHLKNTKFFNHNGSISLFTRSLVYFLRML